MNYILTGKSGLGYCFQQIDTESGSGFYPAIGGVYVFAKKKSSHIAPLYIGESQRIDQRLPTHEKWRCVLSLGCNFIGVYQNEGNNGRLLAETDLRHAYNPPCNDQ